MNKVYAVRIKELREGEVVKTNITQVCEDYLTAHSFYQSEYVNALKGFKAGEYKSQMHYNEGRAVIKLNNGKEIRIKVIVMPLYSQKEEPYRSNDYDAFDSDLKDERIR